MWASKRSVKMQDKALGLVEHKKAMSGSCMVYGLWVWVDGRCDTPKPPLGM